MSVFISYRREGGKQTAAEVYKALSNEYEVFLDTESLKSGPFHENITEQIEKCTDFVIVITDSVFERCDKPGDYILHEAEVALATGANVIPLFAGVTSFPDNIPGSIEELRRFNGFVWKNDETTHEKLKSFLKSNNRCALSIVRRNEGVIGIEDESVGNLKALYRKFVKNGRLPVDIRFRIQEQDIEGLSRLAINQDVAERAGLETARRLARQSLLERFTYLCDALNAAVEHMVQDSLLDSIAERLHSRYTNHYGLENCMFYDERKALRYFWTAYLWVDVINEMLKDLISSRYSMRCDSLSCKTIDCFNVDGSGEVIWSFISFIGKPSQDEDGLLAAMPLSGPNGLPVYPEIPLKNLVSDILPDLYFSIGMLKAGKYSRSYDEVSAHEGAFDLLRYRFGLR